MKTPIFLLAFMTCAIISYSQDITFKDQSLLSLKYVINERAHIDYLDDLPPHLPFFYSLEEYSHLKFSGTINEKRLEASRTWAFRRSYMRGIECTEKIIVEFGEIGKDGRMVTKAFYSKWTSDIMYYGSAIAGKVEWKEMEIEIDYSTDSLFCSYTGVNDKTALSLRMKKPLMEHINSLQGLCQFYNSNLQDSTLFSRGKEEQIRIIHK